MFIIKRSHSKIFSIVVYKMNNQLLVGLLIVCVLIFMMNGKKMKLPKQVEKYSGFIMVGVLVLLFFCMRKKRIVEGNDHDNNPTPDDVPGDEVESLNEEELMVEGDEGKAMMKEEGKAMMKEEGEAMMKEEGKAMMKEEGEPMMKEEGEGEVEAAEENNNEFPETVNQGETEEGGGTGEGGETLEDEPEPEPELAGFMNYPW